MNKKKRNILIASGILAISLTIFTGTLVRATLYAPQPEIPDAEVPIVAPSATSPPVRLVIPAIGVDAAVQKVGITETGNMGVPRNFTDVGWYKYGTAPGDRGSAVIDGHVDNGFRIPAVFFRLKELRAGDELFVETASSTRVRFVVEDVRIYPVSGVPLEEIFHKADTARLNLITCEGEWLPDYSSYDHRVIVYAVRQDA